MENRPRHDSIRLNAMFEAIQLPTRIPDLNPGLADVDADDLSHSSLDRLVDRSSKTLTLDLAGFSLLPNSKTLDLDAVFFYFGFSFKEDGRGYGREGSRLGFNRLWSPRRVPRIGYLVPAGSMGPRFV